ncbi:MAG: hypothetical protein K2M64_00605 [Clostridia bacterium]|nr:hypothetical protein [Clostridia bacterium]
MDNKDFFDEEYSKLENKKEDNNSDNFRNWSSQQPQQSEKAKNNKPLYITLICLALALCIVFGWFMCAIFDSVKSSNKDQSALFDEVLRYLDEKYYKDIPDEKLWAAMEKAGTAMLQSAGDQFSRLMSPSTYYDFCNPQSSYNTSVNGTFGMSLQLVEGIGVYIYEVVTDSSSYGKLQEEDLVYKISDIATLDGTVMEDIITNAVTSESFEEKLANIKSGTFHVIRNGEPIEPVQISRGFVDYVNQNYKFEFIEFYFGDDFTNVSTSNMGSAATNTKDYRKLEELSNLPDTGYIRIKEFSYILVPSPTNPNEVIVHSVLDEFVQVMNLFKQEVTAKDENGNETVIKQPLKNLILDLKGNPGGSVEYVTQIAGMLVTDSKLTESQQKMVRNSSFNHKGEVLITSLYPEIKNQKNKFYVEPKYFNYFDELTDKPNIVVWTDGGSASASELLTGALLDYKTAVQMGTKTYGKGIAQTWAELKNYSAYIDVDGETVKSCWAIYYTAAEYFSPLTVVATGNSIHGKGYTPIDQYNNLDTYEKLWSATVNYFN